jgi:hypothetical protein
VDSSRPGEHDGAHRLERDERRSLDISPPHAGPGRGEEVADDGHHAQVEGLDACRLDDAQGLDDEDAMQRGTRRVERPQAAHDGVDGLARAPGEVLVREHLAHERERAFELAVLERVEDGIAVGEVLVERADADAGHLGDARGGRGVHAFPLENPNRPLEDGGDGGLGTCLARRFSRCGSDLAGHEQKPKET